MTQHSRVSIRPGDLFVRRVSLPAGREAHNIALVIGRKDSISFDLLVTYVSTPGGQSFTRRNVWHYAMLDGWERVG